MRPSHRKVVRAEGMDVAMSVGKVAAMESRSERRVTGRQRRGETSSCMASRNKGTKV